MTSEAVKTLQFAFDCTSGELAALVGPLDENLRQIEHAFDAKIARRGAHFRITGALIAVWGFYQFIHRNFLTYMFLQAHFVFLDYEEPIFLFYLNYLAMMGFFIFVAHYVSGFLKRNKKA